MKIISLFQTTVAQSFVKYFINQPLICFKNIVQRIATTFYFLLYDSYWLDIFIICFIKNHFVTNNTQIIVQWATIVFRHIWKPLKEVIKIKSIAFDLSDLFTDKSDKSNI